ncbi:ABC transporter ATP-binding protein [Kineococcus gynurae]|uniref:ABC transporter ATP-binding protein n=1 Tax=Kineococcus gynurae TaxID=452979 RepID=A0ABV5LNM1_9ACTN
MDEPVISLRAVDRTVRLPDGSDLRILTGVDLDIARGEHVAVVGRSGSGKSTLLNLMGLLDSPTGGEYLLDGRSVAGLSARATAKLRGATFGFVFQQFNLLPGRTATENTASPLFYGSTREFLQRKRIARDMLDRVGLGGRVDAMPETLSGGEQQRVALARSLVRRPRVLLADEPTGALDVDTGSAVMDVLEELVRDDGTTLVTITHDLSVAARADRRFRLDHGVLSPLDADAVADATAHRETV